MQPPRDVAAHAAETDDAELHDAYLIATRLALLYSAPRCRRQRRVKMHAQRAPAAFRQHAKIAARLRGLDHAEACLAAGNRQIGGVVAVICRNTPEFGPPL